MAVTLSYENKKGQAAECAAGLAMYRKLLFLLLLSWLLVSTMNIRRSGLLTWALFF